MLLDLNKGEIIYWLNNRIEKKNKKKELKKPGLTWYPYIRLKEQDIPAILNPFCKLPMADQYAPKFRKRLPQSLSNHGLIYGQVAYVKTLLKGAYILLEQPKIGNDAELEAFIRKVCEDATIETIKVFNKPAGSNEQKRAAFIRFAD